jgi:carbon-monoxide dehydrogenase medium subunit
MSCQYTQARTVDEAVEALIAAKGEAHVIAGGVALVILMNEKLVEPSWLVDISRIEVLHGIDKLPDGTVRIGAAVTHREVAESEIIAQAFPMVPEMAAEIACGRIMNKGTIGGNICLADPQGDPPVAMLALNATMRAVGPDGTRDIPVRDFFLELYTTALREDELLQEILIPPMKDASVTAFGKYAARRAMDYTSTISVAVRLIRDTGDEHIGEIALGFGGVGQIPVYSEEIENMMTGATPSDALFDQVREKMSDVLEPIDDHLYSANYKRHVSAVTLRRTVMKAFDGTWEGEGVLIR